eukprot:TRINITY_DN1139_c0_g1_i3.p1 TRINITY_DN1139_c0_g1~~TRINITY_DN1139_c0_g1_i3.p1  ORF type:complete len:104 (+),score=23.69 TRINITY_DN1139_c0_g1_i3:80-391(+)
MAQPTGEAPSDIRKAMNYPLIRFTDMNEEMRIESVETVVTGIEKFSANYENAARMVKESMDRRYGAAWNCLIGEGFGFEITYESKNLLYMFFGNLAVLLYKAG